GLRRAGLGTRPDAAAFMLSREDTDSPARRSIGRAPPLLEDGAGVAVSVRLPQVLATIRDVTGLEQGLADEEAGTGVFGVGRERRIGFCELPQAISRSPRRFGGGEVGGESWVRSVGADVGRMGPRSGHHLGVMTRVIFGGGHHRGSGVRVMTHQDRVM